MFEKYEQCPKCECNDKNWIYEGQICKACGYPKPEYEFRAEGLLDFLRSDLGMSCKDAGIEAIKCELEHAFQDGLFYVLKKQDSA